MVIDHVEGLGEFAEVETLVDAEVDLATAQAAVIALAHDLGLVEVESRSYLRLILEAAGQLGRNPAGQT